jgi:hypothetical protein
MTKLQELKAERKEKIEAIALLSRRNADALCAIYRRDLADIEHKIERMEGDD